VKQQINSYPILVKKKEETHRLEIIEKRDIKEIKEETVQLMKKLRKGEINVKKGVEKLNDLLIKGRDKNIEKTIKKTIRIYIE
jgi:hypothetical protein